MSRPVVFGLYGYSDAGKTSLLVKLVTQFTAEGYHVATIKKTHASISLDTQGKDTCRHHDAGACLVVFSSGIETDFLLPTSLSVSTIVEMVSVLGSYDLILVEGADDPAIPKIQLGGRRKRKNTVISYKDNYQEIMKIIKKELKMKQSSQRLSLRVNGRNISLSKFPEQIFINTLIGMMQSLKGVKKINEFTIQLQ